MTEIDSVTQSLMARVGVGSAQTVLERCANPFYERAISKNRNFGEAVALRDKALLARAELAAAGPQPPPMPTTVDDDLEQWHAARADARAAEAEWTARDQNLAELIAHCDARIQGVGLDRDTILTSLQTDLDELLTRVATAVDKLGGARTPAEAIAGSVGDAWNALSKLRSEYDLIRAAQGIAMIGTDDPARARSNYLSDDPLASDAAIANLDKVFPNWRDAAPPSVTQVGFGGHDRPQPYPDDPVGQLIWLIDSGAKVWIPTSGQLDALWQRRRNSRAEASNGRVLPHRPDRPQPINRTENVHV